MAEFNKILVANRGEIALRIMRSIKEMGISTVAVYSEADRLAPFVQFADEAVLIGAAPSSESYLNGAKILQVCQELSVDAVHPGYGFLSENATFARDVVAAGIVFIGPSPESMEIMGSKLMAKRTVSKYDIPLVPGTDQAVKDIPEALKAADAIGFPILIKASAGGGGKGMRVVESPEEFETQMDRAISEAESAFGDGSIFIEKFIAEPRHIEIQILGDQHGNVIHLFERECSIQRRHQKVIEEAPSSVLDEQLRERMGLAAVSVARSCDYYGAGTVEFMLDTDGSFYFLEMNTRLQVEHPVTEYITGLDLVKEQIKVAAGLPLTIDQNSLTISGHAIEARVYAEDPQNNFLPDIGTLHNYRRPQGPGVRVDDGFEQGMEIPIHYDPMIAKLVVHGQNRNEAIARMIRAIEEYEINGISTTLEFCKFVMQHPAFISGKYTTKFVEQHFAGTMNKSTEVQAERIAVILGATLWEGKKNSVKQATSDQHQSHSPWLNRNKDS